MKNSLVEKPIQIYTMCRAEFALLWRYLLRRYVPIVQVLIGLSIGFLKCANMADDVHFPQDCIARPV
jgi:hypothetical protein